jgi:hypothetical protein
MVKHLQDIVSEAYLRIKCFSETSRSRALADNNKQHSHRLASAAVIIQCFSGSKHRDGKAQRVR